MNIIYTNMSPTSSTINNKNSFMRVSTVPIGYPATGQIDASMH